MMGILSSLVFYPSAAPEQACPGIEILILGGLAAAQARQLAAGRGTDRGLKGSPIESLKRRPNRGEILDFPPPPLSIRVFRIKVV
jgi:hypothetical protein